MGSSAGRWSVEGQKLVGGTGRREEGLFADGGHFDGDELTFQVGDAAIDMRPEPREPISWAAGASSAASARLRVTEGSDRGQLADQSRREDLQCALSEQLFWLLASAPWPPKRPASSDCAPDTNNR